MSPELHILGLVIVFFAVAYLFIYPRLQKKSLRRLMQVDLLLFVVLLVIAGSVYYGTQTSFTLLFFETWWWLYTIIIGAIVETPLFLWFARRWNIDLDKLDD